MYKKGFQCQIPGLAEIYMEYFDYIDSGFFVEVGAHDCYTWSNTWPLAQAGWSGIYFEPNPSNSGKCHEMYDANDKISLSEIAIGDYEGATDLIVAGSVSTIKDEVADLYSSLVTHNILGINRKKKIGVKISTLDIELPKYDVWPGFEVLVIDVEGSEMDVLQGFQIDEWQPEMVIIEAHEHHKSGGLRYAAEDINLFFAQYCYEKIYSDHINNIYVR